MEQKSLRNNRPKAWDRLNIRREELKPCPFCGNRVQTRVAEKTGARWFDCNLCTMALKFEMLNPEEAIEAWNERFE